VNEDRRRGQASVAVVAAQTLGLKLALVVIATIATIVVSRILGPEGRGIYYIPVVAAATIVAFGKLGLEQANVYLYGSQSISADRLGAQSTLVTVVAGSGGIIAMFLLPSLLPAVFGDVPPVLLLLGALAIPLSLHTQFISGLQNLVGQVTLQFRAAIVGGLVQLAALLVLAFTGLVTVAAVMALNLLGGLVTWLWTLRTSVVPPYSVRWDPGLIRQTVGHSLVLHAGLVLFFLHLRVDTFMVKAINGPGAVGIYSLSVVVAETVLLATDSVSIALLPRQVGVAIRDSAQVALRAARINAYLALAFGVALVATGWIAIPLLFGVEFTAAYPPLVALAPGIVFISMQRVCGPPVLRAGTPWLLTGIYAVSLAANISLNLVWIPQFGAVGASMASSISYGLAAALFLGWTSVLAGSTAALRPSRSDAALVLVAITLASRLARRKPLAASER